jgi:hypothetical protein
MANIIIDESTSKLLRDLAASLGFYITRGPGASEQMGNIKAMLDRLGQVYAESPEIVRAMLQILVRWNERDAKGARPWVDLMCQHAWLGDADVVPSVCPVCGDTSGEFGTVYDMHRIHKDDTVRFYDETTAWARMANRDMKWIAQSLSQ